MMDDGCDEVDGSTNFSMYTKYLCRQGRQVDQLFLWESLVRIHDGESLKIQLSNPVEGLKGKLTIFEILILFWASALHNPLDNAGANAAQGKGPLSGVVQ